MQIAAYLPAQHAPKCPAWDHWPCECCAKPVPLVRLSDVSPEAGKSDTIDIEQMLRDTVPGGHSVDPQRVCDDIRTWFALWTDQSDTKGGAE